MKTEKQKITLLITIAAAITAVGLSAVVFFIFYGVPSAVLLLFMMMIFVPNLVMWMLVFRARSKLKNK